MKTEHSCWNFVMSSFVRSYGRSVLFEEKFHEIALQWCDDNNYICNIHLDDLSKVDAYFKKYYEEFEGR
jgi:hypothetical protein